MKKEKKDEFISVLTVMRCDDGKHSVAIGILVEDETKFGFEIRGGKEPVRGTANTKHDAFMKAIDKYKNIR